MDKDKKRWAIEHSANSNADGSPDVDGVPVRTLEDIISAQRWKLSRLAALTGGEVPREIAIQKAKRVSVPLKAVRAVETGRIYPDVHTAARQTKTTAASIRSAIVSKGRAGKFHWERAEEGA